MITWYNENDKKAAAWLRELADADLIPGGIVDERSIRDVQSEEIPEGADAHFFAGIGGWERALFLADWPTDREVWTGSCPCQPFSCAGARKGTGDRRHLWPEFLRIISIRRPSTIFGEQVAGADGREWFSGVRSDLERLGYAVGGADLCAAGIGAPHLRQRLYWVADADHSGREGRRRKERRSRSVSGSPIRGRVRGMADAQRIGRGPFVGGRVDELNGETPGREEEAGRLGIRGRAGRMADADGRDSGDGEEQRSGKQRQPKKDRSSLSGSNPPGHRQDGPSGRVGNADMPRRPQHGRAVTSGEEISPPERGSVSGGVGNSESRGRGLLGDETFSGSGRYLDGPNFWGLADWIQCQDGKRRRIPAGSQPVLFPLADGISPGLGDMRSLGYGQVFPGLFPLCRRMKGRPALLRGAGNAIVPQVAAVFIRAFMLSKGWEC